MRRFDIWLREDNLLRENWVLVDILSVYDQLGVDVFSRMREMTFAQQQPQNLDRRIINWVNIKQQNDLF